MDKFIDDNDSLKGGVEKMVPINELEEVKKLFPDSVNKIMEEGRKEGIKKAMEEGENDGRMFVARNMKELGDDPRDIAIRTGLSLDKIREL